jgi:hypothetical protein
MGDGRTVLSPVVQAGGVWRVQITWADGSKHLFGKFGTKQEAESWIAEHWASCRFLIRLEALLCCILATVRKMSGVALRGRGVEMGSPTPMGAVPS